MKFIKVNITKIVLDVLFYPFRAIKRNVDWVKYMISYIVKEYKDIVNIKNYNYFLAKHTNQKLSFEHLLNNIDDVNGAQLVVGRPIVCETTGNIPLFYSFTDEELSAGTIPTRITGFYNDVDNNIIWYNPTNSYIFTEEEVYDIDGNLNIDIEDAFWSFSEEENGATLEYTIYVDPVDYIGLIGYDDNNKPVYANNSKLDIIDKYAKQYTCLGVSYKIVQQ